MKTWMRIALAAALAGGFVAGLAVPAGRLATGDPVEARGQAPAATRAPVGRTSSCTGVVTSTLSTDRIRLCDEAAVTASVFPTCPACPGGIHVVYVQVDRAFQAAWMDREAVASLRVLESYRDQEIRVGVVHYNSQMVKRALQMTDNIGRAYGPLNEPTNGHDPHGDFVGAAREALRMLDDARDDHARAGGSEQDEPCEFIIYFASTKSIFVQDEQKMLDAAQMIKRRKIKLMVGCPENNPDYCQGTKRMPESSRYYTEFNDNGRLRRMVEDEMDNLMDSLGLSSLTMWQLLPPGLQFVEGSASEAPKVERTAGKETRLTWDWIRLTNTKPHTVTYRVKPLEEGNWPVTGSVTLKDKTNLTREMPLPERAVVVAGDCSEPTPTPPPPPTETPEPTNTAPPTATAVPTATFTPTATPTRVPSPLYLPIILREECTKEHVYTDVVLVLDMSTSMNRSGASGRSKLAATLEAAERFVERMSFEPDATGRQDRVAVVGFNGTAWVELALSGDGAAVVAALRALPARQAEGTRLDLAFERGAEALAGHAPDSTPVIVLLTDGLPNQVPVAEDGRMETTVLRAAQQAKDLGARVYTIGIGVPTDIDAALLRSAASTAEDFYYTPDPETLGSIYSQIAYSFGCPGGRHDWSRPWSFGRTGVVKRR